MTSAQRGRGAGGGGGGGGSKNAPSRWIQSIVLKIRTTWGATKSKILWMSYAALEMDSVICTRK